MGNTEINDNRQYFSVKNLVEQHAKKISGQQNFDDKPRNTESKQLHPEISSPLIRETRQIENSLIRETRQIESPLMYYHTPNKINKSNKDLQEISKEVLELQKSFIIHSEQEKRLCSLEKEAKEIKNGINDISENLKTQNDHNINNPTQFALNKDPDQNNFILSSIALLDKRFASVDSKIDNINNQVQENKQLYLRENHNTKLLLQQIFEQQKSNCDQIRLLEEQNDLLKKQLKESNVNDEKLDGLIKYLHNDRKKYDMEYKCKSLMSSSPERNNFF